MALVYAVIMAGGRGERFWPLSTDTLPKPFIPLLGTKTLIQETVERLLPLVPIQRILVSIGKSHREVAGEQLPQVPPENFIVEPVGRDTAACLGLCALHLESRDPDGTMLALPADHYIGDSAAYRATLQMGIDNLDDATGVVFGIVPNRPETGYGYIQAERPAVRADAWPVLRFVEKPDAGTAAGYVRSGDFFWNSGIFLWKNSTLLDLFRQHMPDTWEGLNDLRKLMHRPGKGAEEEISRVFVRLRRISIDFGIMEKTSGLRLVPARFGWDDIGNWAALERALPPDDFGNVSRGQHAAVMSNGCVVYSDTGTVATFGLSDLIVVQANGKVLVCPKDRASDLKRLVASLGPEGSRDGGAKQ
jgi:mannose-1-phosphate guanylyltransferase